MPVLCNQLWPDVETARAAPSGDVDLVGCTTCAFIWNRQFDPERMVYESGYENALHHSPKFRAFASDLTHHLIERHDLAGKHVVEIGCGDGHILDLMVKHGAATATGYDPSMAGRESQFTAREGVRIIPEYFASRKLDGGFDAIICRHVLEHLDEPQTLLTQIRHAIGDRDVVVYFEVPNAGWMLDGVSMWDVIYEHVGYWSAPALTTAFVRAGFEPVNVSTGYSEQFLMIEARPAKIRQRDFVATGTDKIKTLSNQFAASAQEEMIAWRARLGSQAGKTVIWGAGSKGITFANAMGTVHSTLDALIDLNPRKKGLFVPGVGLEVRPPQDLRLLAPDHILIANALYRDEIADQVRAMGLSPSFATLTG
ncbi:class I SAM-dependent methyltransferase [Pontibaca salina]|nr:class I SAM-dependent methyltransferase [Pontibaca salina]